MNMNVNVHSLKHSPEIKTTSLLRVSEVSLYVNLNKAQQTNITTIADMMSKLISFYFTMFSSTFGEKRLMSHGCLHLSRSSLTSKPTITSNSSFSWFTLLQSLVISVCRFSVWLLSEVLLYFIEGKLSADFTTIFTTDLHHSFKYLCIIDHCISDFLHIAAVSWHTLSSQNKLRSILII